MTEATPILRDLVLIAGLALIVSLVFQRLKAPVMTGFILTGAVIGPGGLGLIHDQHSIETLAQIGVVVLLFTIGLDFSLADLRSFGPRTLAAGALQIALTAGLLTPVLVLAGQPLVPAVFFGLMASISSTTLLIRGVTDRGELQSPQGRLIIGVSLVQDLSLVPLTLMVPVLAAWAAGHAAPGGALDATRVLLVTGGSILVVVAGWRGLPWLLDRAARARSRETFLAATVLVVLGSAFVSQKVGLPIAVGAFLGGLLLAGSQVSSQMAADLLPFRDTLSSVFFISIGMLFSPAGLTGHVGVAVMVLVTLIVVKLVAGVLAGRIAGFPPTASIATGLALAHVGEFAFVLGAGGRAAGLLTPEWEQVFVAAALPSMLVAPLLGMVATPWAHAMTARRGGAAAASAETLDEGLEHHVVIAGFGLNGRNVARVLRTTLIPHIVLDQSPHRITLCAQDGSRALLGNAVQSEILIRAGIERARALVVALSDPGATRHATRNARSLHPGLFIVVRTRYVHEVDAFYAAGANLVIPEEFETSIEIFVAVLQQFHIPTNIIDAQVAMLRLERYSVLRGQKLPVSVVEQLHEILAEGTVETARVLQQSPAVGRTLGQLGLDSVTDGACVVAVVRGGRAITSPEAHFPIQAGDTLVLAGAHAQIDEALERLAPLMDHGRPSGPLR